MALVLVAPLPSSRGAVTIWYTTLIRADSTPQEPQNSSHPSSKSRAQNPHPNRSTLPLPNPQPHQAPPTLDRHLHRRRHDRAPRHRSLKNEPPPRAALPLGREQRHLLRQRIPLAALPRSSSPLSISPPTLPYRTNLPASSARYKSPSSSPTKASPNRGPSRI